MAESQLPKHNSTKSKEKVTVDLARLFPETEERKRFYAATGRFISYYSLVEQMLVVVLHHYSQTKIRVGLALFSNWRPDQTINALHKVIQVRKLRGPKIKELKAILQQISIITKVRNDLVHLGSHGEKAKTKNDVRLLSNYLLAYSRKARRETPISTKILNQMYGDLFKCSFRLLNQMMDTRPRVKNKISVSDLRKRDTITTPELAIVMAKLFRRAYPASRLPAWRYIQPVTKKRRRKNRARRPARAIPPRPLPG
jgi:hypothetical protein